MISVIIPTRNRAELLQRALSSIESLKLPKCSFEIIVVDNGSEDRTSDVCRFYKNKILQLRYIYEPQIGLHKCRNLALEKAKGDIFCYIDDDSFVDKEWLRGVEDSFKDQSVVLAGGPCLPEYEKPPPNWINKIWNHNEYGSFIGHFSLIDFGTEKKWIPPNFIYGCNFCIRKQILLEIGGFHPDGMPKELIRFRGDGETFVTQKITDMGHKAFYNPEIKIKHYVSKSRLSFEYLKWRSYIQGISSSYAAVRKKNGLDCFTKKNITFFIIKILYKIRNKFKKILFKKCETLDLEKDDLNKQLKESYIQGFNYHQQKVKQDVKLEEWVLRENYMGRNSKLPE
jgi:glucosyl-dolichyl phosphate glucuronosyltransferase